MQSEMDSVVVGENKEQNHGHESSLKSPTHSSMEDSGHFGAEDLDQISPRSQVNAYKPHDLSFQLVVMISYAFLSLSFSNFLVNYCVLWF